MNINEVLKNHGIGVGKYKKGTFIPISKLSPSIPIKIFDYNPNNTYNQNIHRKYANDETGHIFIPVYTDSSDIIRMYNVDGITLKTFSYNRTAYSNIIDMIEYNGFLFVFGGTGIQKFNVSTGTFIQGITTQNCRVQGGYACKADNIVYFKASNGYITKFNLDTFSEIGSFSAAISGIQAMDEDKNIYGVDFNRQLYKYTETGVNLWSITLNHYARHDYRILHYSKIRNSILVSTYVYESSKIFLEEWGVDGNFINKIDVASVNGGIGGSESYGVFKSGEWLLYHSLGNVFVFKESDLSYIKRLGLFGFSDHVMHISNKFIVATMVGQEILSAYVMGIEIKE